MVVRRWATSRGLLRNVLGASLNLLVGKAHDRLVLSTLRLSGPLWASLGLSPPASPPASQPASQAHDRFPGRNSPSQPASLPVPCRNSACGYIDMLPGRTSAVGSFTCRNSSCGELPLVVILLVGSLPWWSQFCLCGTSLVVILLVGRPGFEVDFCLEP